MGGEEPGRGVRAQGVGYVHDTQRGARAESAPAPGGPRELAELAARLNAIPLNRARPLWEMWLIDGVVGGHVAVLSKVHHAAIDGASGNEITVATLDVDTGSLDVIVRIHPRGCDADDVDNVLEQASWALRSGGLLIITIPIGPPSAHGAVGPAGAAP